MPSLNDVRVGTDIGYKSHSSKYIWAACVDCGKERWVRYLGHKPGTALCPTCASRRHRLSGENSPSWKGGLVKTTCAYCGKELLARPCRLKVGADKFCSHACQNLSREKKVKCICLWCSKDFLRHPSNVMPSNLTFCSKSCSSIYHYKNGTFSHKVTKPEKMVIQICDNYGLPYKYVGDGQIWIGRHNPDFINTNHRKQVIEVFGSYWHPLFDEAKLREYYKQYGFECLVIWDDQLKNITKVTKTLRHYARE